MDYAYSEKSHLHRSMVSENSWKEGDKQFKQDKDRKSMREREKVKYSSCTVCAKLLN